MRAINSQKCIPNMSLGWARLKAQGSRGYSSPSAGGATPMTSERPKWLGTKRGLRWACPLRSRRRAWGRGRVGQPGTDARTKGVVEIPGHHPAGSRVGLAPVSELSRHQHVGPFSRCHQGEVCLRLGAVHSSPLDPDRRRGWRPTRKAALSLGPSESNALKS